MLPPDLKFFIWMCQGKPDGFSCVLDDGSTCGGSLNDDEDHAQFKKRMAAATEFSEWVIYGSIGDPPPGWRPASESEAAELAKSVDHEFFT